MSNTMWGGRFATGPAEIMEEINASIAFDRRLAAQDIAGSLAHVAMLAAQGVVDQADADAIAAGLKQVKGEIEAGTFAFSRALEDIHMNVESRLAAIVGPAAGRRTPPLAQTTRSPSTSNCGCATRSTRSTARLRICNRRSASARSSAPTWVMPGFTHLQSAQPVTFATPARLCRDAGARQRPLRRRA